MNNIVYGQPEVSVVTAVYNRANYLGRCIGSLLNQTFKNWELIAVDDGSEDDTFKILKEYEKTYKNIKVFWQTNRKLPLSRNKGIEVSSGKFITFLDSDDEYEKDHLEKHFEFMKKNPEVDLIHGGVNIIGDEYVKDKNNPHKLIHLSKCTIGGTFFGKRNVFIDLKGFKNLKYSEDSDFLERAEKIYNVKKVNFNTYKYHRDAPDSITNSYEP
ncbi:MAG: glycosyltransferase family 2 protein [Ignavibacteriaceae bacterium]